MAWVEVELGRRALVVLQPPANPPAARRSTYLPRLPLGPWVLARDLPSLDAWFLCPIPEQSNVLKSSQHAHGTGGGGAGGGEAGVSPLSRAKTNTKKKPKLATRNPLQLSSNTRHHAMPVEFQR